ncbi:endonuclease/exonuclease/phosphatase family protein [uncultured Kriegella sp.]|uniref:endonuclease/exonuclease/phosphatase family protein n=1 Tax=uncultured Kriegella sp. TaxID=1798910 RepID=UPI0030DC379D|tara:strand:+ start:82231 stop:83007 length:777 start_codon:yes stop_codon:yes gene_type:complete
MRKLLIVLFIGLTMKVSQAQSDTLRVMSFNILHGATVKNDFNLDTIAGVINSYSPDLVALQEVDFKTNRAKNYDLPTELGYRTQMASLFARAMYYDGGEYGEGVLSKYSFISTENIALPHLPNSEPRAAAVVRVKTKNGNIIQFVGTHLDHQKDEKDRMMQANALVKQLGESKYPTLLLGDLNATPESETINIITKAFTKSTISEAQQGTYPSTGPHKKIDYILYNQPKHWKMLEYKVLCENYASDHCIVMATLVFTP